MEGTVDLLVIGGGINGAAVARDASGRGLRVLLVEAGDLGGATSSSSTKLIHGGLRYLEYREFRLVREALAERAVMIRTAPHLVRPMRFVLPHAPGVRPWWIVRAGLLLYDLLAIGGGLPRSRGLNLAPPPLKPDFRRGFAYWDAWVDDSRLVILNAIDARARSADIRPRTRLAAARREGGRWIANVEDVATGAVTQVSASAIANLSGPWISDVAARLGVTTSPVRLVRGSHVIVPRIAGHDDAMLLQQPDGRIIFLIPYLDRFSLIGTTEVAVDDPGDATISAEERAYLIEAANRFLATPLANDSIVATYAGIRALDDDGAADSKAVTRDYRLALENDGTPLLTAYGGKITTARALAAHAVDMLAPGTRGWTHASPLPGGDLSAPFDAALAMLEQAHPWLGPDRARRMLHAYGSMLREMLHGVRNAADMGEDFGGGLTAREVDHLIDNEWARTAEDILWRRTRIGLLTGPDTAERLTRYLAERTL